MKKISVAIVMILLFLFAFTNLSCKSKFSKQKSEEHYYFYFVNQPQDKKELLSHRRIARAEIAAKWSEYIYNVEDVDNDYNKVETLFQNITDELDIYHKKELEWLEKYQSSQEWLNNRTLYVEKKSSDNGYRTVSEERINYLRGLAEKEIGKKPQWDSVVIDEILSSPINKPKKKRNRFE